MKKNRIYLLLTLVLGIAAAYLLWTKRSGTLKEELKNFALQDTAGVSKIILSDRSGKKIELEEVRTGKWMVNKEHAARPDAVQLLLETMLKVQVKSPIAKSAHNTIVKNLAGTSVKVEIYEGDELVKAYYVGGPTQEHDGTYMLMENSSAPFVTFIPGFRGFLTPRYFTDLNDWRDRTLFRYQEEDIASVDINYAGADSSFRVTARPLSLETSAGSKIIPFDSARVISFLSHCKNLSFESFPSNEELAFRDSILKTSPFCTITITDANNRKNALQLYRKPLPANALKEDEFGNPVFFDPEKLFLLTGSKDFVIGQYFVFDHLLKKLNHFRPEGPGAA